MTGNPNVDFSAVVVMVVFVVGFGIGIAIYTVVERIWRKR